MQLRIFSAMQEPASPNANHIRRGTSPRFHVVIINKTGKSFLEFRPFKNEIILFTLKYKYWDDVDLPSGQHQSWWVIIVEGENGEVGREQYKCKHGQRGQTGSFPAPQQIDE